MSALPINANIYEVDAEPGNGRYFPVRLNWVPRVGELIEMTSFAEIAAKHTQYILQYKVIQVVHYIGDLSDKFEHTQKGSHSVVVHVEKTQIPDYNKPAN